MLMRRYQTAKGKIEDGRETGEWSVSNNSRKQKEGILMMTKYTRWAAGALAGLTAAAVIAGCAGTGSGSAKSAAKAEQTGAIKVAYTASLCQAPLFVAKEKGYFKDAGLDAEMIRVDGAQANEAIGSGKVDAMQTLIMKTIHPWQNGLPVKATVGIHTGCVRVVVRNDGSVNTVQDLKGKKIGVAGLADTGAIVAQRALKHAGIGVTPDNMEVEFVTIDRNSLPQALESGQVDAIAMTDPVGAIAEKQYGFKSVVDTAKSDGFKDEYCCDLVLSNKYLEEHPELAKKFNEAVIKAAVYVHEHPEETAKLLAEKKYIAGNPEDNAKLLASYNYQPSIEGGYDAVKASAQDLGELGLTEKVDGKTFADQYFLHIDGLSDKVSL